MKASDITTAARRRPRGTLRTLAAGGALASIGVAARRAWTRGVPDYDERLHLPGLQGEVTVLRDRWGIPVIRAEHEPDALLAQGFVHAADRLFSMDVMRRAGHGRLAELLDRPALASDRLMRTLGFTHVARRELRLLDERTRHNLERYAMGVNAYVEHAGGTRAGLGLEFAMLGYHPEPWQPADSLMIAKLFALGLCGNWEAELTRLEIRERFGTEVLELLDDDGASRDWPAQLDPEVLGTDAATGVGDTADTSGDDEDVHAGPEPEVVSGDVLLNAPEVLGEVHKAIRLARRFLGGGDGAGSNGWVVNGERSDTGSPILANDTHLDLTLPNVWFENGITTPTLHARGVSVAGSPGIVAGHNGKIAWGITNSTADVQDLYVERLNGDGTTYLDTDDQHHRLDVRREKIKVRLSPDATQVVRSTRRGPLITDAVEHDLGGVALSLRWDSVLTPGRTADAFDRLVHATDWESFRDALRLLRAPSQNVLFADATGHVGVQLCGELPVRAGGPSQLPRAGADPEGEWTGTVPWSEMPRALDPPAGRIASANDRLAPRVGPYVSDDYVNGWRGERIRQLLDADDAPRDAAGHAAAQCDLRSLPGTRLANAVQARSGILPATADGLAAHRALLAWDGVLDANSEGGAVYGVLIEELERVLTSALGELGPAATGHSRGPAGGTYSAMHKRLVPRIIHDIETDDRRLLRLAVRGTPTLPDEWDPLLARLFDRTAERLVAACGHGTRWTWGAVHQVRLAHGFGFLPGAHRLLSRGPFPAGGDLDTVWQASHAPKVHNDRSTVGPAKRMVVDLADPDRSVCVLAGGQSGHVASPHYADQLDLWLAGETRPMPFSDAAVDAAAVHRQRLLPSPRRGTRHA